MDILKCHLLLFYTTTTNHFSIRLWHATKSEFYTTSNDQLSDWTEKKLQSTFQSQTCTKKKVMVTVWWSATGLIHYSFLNPSESITSEKYAQQINEIYWKLQCLQLALVDRAKFFSMTNLTSCHNQCFKSWTNSATKFCLICHIHLPSCQPTSTSSSILTSFCKENDSTTTRIQKIHGILCHGNKQTYFSLAKMCWL